MKEHHERQSAIDLWFPQLDEVIGAWRRAHVPVAKYGVAPHISLLYPWCPAPVGHAEIARLRTALQGLTPFQVTFREFRRFPGVLWLAPEPREAVLTLADAVMTAFPEIQPYGGQFVAPEPHLTVAKGSGNVLDRVEREVTERLQETGPLRAAVDRITVVEQDERGFWRVTHELSLAAQRAG